MYVELQKAMMLILLVLQEINTAKEQSDELIEKVLHRSKLILEGLLSAAKSPHEDRLTCIEGKLTGYRE